MQGMRFLEEFKPQVDREIERHLDLFIMETAQHDQLIKGMLEYVKKMVLASGKRLRPAMMYLGYLAGGGERREEIIKTSASIELAHMFLLIHDDIIDHGTKRHGIPTLQVEYGNLGKKISSVKDHQHFGNSVALIVGDLVSALSNRILYESDFEPKLILQALKKLQDIISLTVVGETKDVYIEYRGQATEREVLEMYEYKTARYTFEGPLHLGAILSGADKTTLEVLSNYAIPMGIAFQIQDDLLGIFGSEEKIGKEGISDIEEGKQTLLVVKAWQEANDNQREALEKILGKKVISVQEINSFKKIIEETGSLQYSRQLVKEYIEKGRLAIRGSGIKEEAKVLLLEVADLMLKREA